MSEKDKQEDLKELEQIELTPEESIMDAMVSRQETKIANAKAKIKVLTKSPAGVGEHMDGLLNDTEKALQEIADAESILDAIEKHHL
mgnify:CR=1 FL=1